MKKKLYYVSEKYRSSVTEKWQHVYVHIVASSKNVKKIVNMIFDHNIADDPSMEFKDIQYYKIKKASEVEKEMLESDYGYLKRVDGTRVGVVPETLMMFDNKKYES